MYFGILSHESLLIMYFGMPPSCALSLLLYSEYVRTTETSLLHYMGLAHCPVSFMHMASFLFSSFVALTYPSQQFRPNSCLLILNLTLFFKLFTLNNHTFFLTMRTQQWIWIKVCLKRVRKKLICFVSDARHLELWKWVAFTSSLIEFIHNYPPEIFRQLDFTNFCSSGFSLLSSVSLWCHAM